MDKNEGGHFLEAAPGLSVADLGRAIKFYEESLGFKKGYSNEAYAVMRRDEVGIHLSTYRRGDRAGKGFCTVFVHEVDRVYDECVKNGVTIERSPEDSKYGLRDFVIADLDGNTITIGEEPS